MKWLKRKWNLLTVLIKDKLFEWKTAGMENKYWSDSIQRHHDYFVFEYRRTNGMLSKEDMVDYELAMQREQNGEVKPLLEDAESPFG